MVGPNACRNMAAGRRQLGYLRWSASLALMMLVAAAVALASQLHDDNTASGRQTYRLVARDLALHESGLAADKPAEFIAAYDNYYQPAEAATTPSQPGAASSPLEPPAGLISDRPQGLIKKAPVSSLPQASAETDELLIVHEPLAKRGDTSVGSSQTTPGDLNAAAGGHHYGKVKKKKKVKVKKIVKMKKKKKKKIVIKKKKKKMKKKKKFKKVYKVKKYKKIKKKKKYKKIKVVKYKKKKKVKKGKKMHHYKKPHSKHVDHGKYYMYAKVPKKKTWEFGFKKGNKKHWIERHEKGHKNKFKTKVLWFDKKSKGKGVHIWDYNHHDMSKKHKKKHKKPMKKKKKKHHYA